MQILLDKEKIDYLFQRGIEVLWSPGTSTITDDCVLEPPCSIKWMKTEHNIMLGAFSYAVSGYYAAANIGRYCSIGEQVQIGRSDHPMTWLSTHPFQYLREPIYRIGHEFPDADLYHQYLPPLPPSGIQPTCVKQVHIGHDVWIGHGAMIRPGVTIGNGAVIGAYAVVTKDVEPYAIVAGNPARLIRKRFSDDVIAELQRISWWRFAPWQLESVPFHDIDKAILRLKALVPTLTEYRPSLIRLKDNPSSSVADSLRDGSSHVDFIPECSANTLREEEAIEKQYPQVEVDSPEAPSERPLNRHMADAYFAKCDFGKALHCYAQSIKANEEGIIYAYLNGAILACALGRYYLAGRWLLAASRIFEHDPVNSKRIVKMTLKSVLDSGNTGLYHYLARRLGLARRDIAYSEVKCIIVGFPRCGTTSVARHLARQLNLQEGLTDEALSRIDVARNMDELWTRFLESFCYVESLDGNEAGSNRGFIDKSAAISVSRDLMLELINRFTDALVIVCRRNSYDRSVSAFRRCTNLRGYGFLAAVSREISIINDLGGVGKIFNSIRVLCEFANQMGREGLNYPIVYPTAVMDNFGLLLSDSCFERVVFYDIDTGFMSRDIGLPAPIELGCCNQSVNENGSFGEDDHHMFFKLLESLVI